MKKILVLLLFIVIAITGSTIRPKAALNGLAIDTSSRQAALSSIVRIFTNWKNTYPTAYYNIYGCEAYKLYLFANDLTLILEG